MPNRVLALVGIGQSPTIFIRELLNPHLEIRRGSEDLKLTLENEFGVVVLQGPGPHKLQQSEWVRVCVEGDFQTLPCIISG